MSGRSLAVLLRQGLTALVIVAVVFLLVRTVPGDAIDVLGIEGDLTEEEMADRRAELGLDRPWLEQFALCLSRETGARGVTVNVLSPGVTRTDGLVAPPEMVAMLVQQTPLGRLGEASEVAAAAVTLCLPGMGWVNGQVIHANGGIL